MNELHDPYCPKSNLDAQNGKCICVTLEWTRRDEREIAVAIMNSYIQSFKNGFSYDQWETMVNDVLQGADK